MKQTIAILCLIGASLSGFSQDKSFDLSKYKFPDYKRHELELNFNSSGYNMGSSWNQIPTSQNNNADKTGWSAANSQSNLGLSYSYNKIDRKSIDYLYSSLSGNYAYSMQDNYLQKEKQFKPEINWNFGGTRDYYLTENKFFVEGFLNSGLSFKKTKITIDNNVNQNDNDNSFNAAIGLGVGYGRKEKVSDLWQAYYILENLKKQNSLVRELKENDIFEFANFTSKLKNKRFFDFRLRKIAELQALDSLLQKQGLIKDSDILYFTTLNDYWNFCDFPDRLSGRIFKFWLSPEYWSSRNMSLNNSTINNNSTYLKSNISFECDKQLNLFWERIVKLYLSNVTLLDQTDENITNHPKNLLFTSLEMSYGYYPNTRTGLHASVGYAGKEVTTSSYQSPGLPSKFWNNEINMGLNGVYYISQHLQLYGNFNLTHGFEAYQNGNHERFDYNLGLRYAIF